MSTRNMVIGIIVAVVVAGGIFFGGMKYGEARQTSALASRFGAGRGTAGGGTFQGRGGTGAPGGARVGANAVVGQILSSDATSITVKLPTGGSRIVFTNASTSIMTAAQGTISDLVVGKNVVVQGNSNSDGSLTAQSIQVRPEMGM